MKKLFTILFLLLGATVISNAQSSVDEIVKEWERAKTYTKEYLDAMPAANMT